MQAIPDQPITPAIDYTLTVIGVTSNAQANGTATNSFTVRLTAGDELIDDTFIDFSVSGSALFNPTRQNFITVMTNNQGEATVFFTNDQEQTVRVRAVFGSDFAEADSTFGMPASDADLLLEAQVSPSDVVAGSGDPHIINYFLTNALGQFINGRQINYSVIGVATLNPPTMDFTSGNGQTQLRVTRAMPGTVTVIAALASAPGIVYSRIRLTFSASVLTQYIAAQKQVDGAPANGMATNRIRYQVKSLAGNVPVAFTPVHFSVAGGAIPIPDSDRTDASGYVTITFTSRFPGPMLVSATLDSGLGSTNHTGITFT